MSYLRRFGKYAVDLEKVVVATPELVVMDGGGVVKMDAESAAALLAEVPEWEAEARRDAAPPEGGEG